MDGLSPLFGIPIGIKDIIDLAGLPTGAGSQARSKGPAAARDAVVAKKLREAGAVILGKTVTTQFACFDPPPTRNPWNLDPRRRAGRRAVLPPPWRRGCASTAIGSQTGGSITRPAAFCGVAGCKPNFGRVSCTGFVPLSPSMDTPGPIGSCVADLAALLNVISGSDRDTPIPAGSDKLVLDPADWKLDRGKPPRLVRLGGFFESAADASMRSALDQAAATRMRFRRACFTVVEGALPGRFMWG